MSALARPSPRSSSVRRGGRGLAGLVLALGVLGWWAGPAYAHAELETTNPADQAVVATSPKQIVLTFSEGVAVQADGVRVLNGDADRMALGKAAAKDSVVTVPVSETLPKGGYVVAWRVLSADGHPVRGSFQFYVGGRTALDAGLADQAFQASGDDRDEVVGAFLRILSMVGALGAAGAVLVGGWLRRDDEPSPVTRLVAVLASASILALLAQLPLNASLATGRGWGSIGEAGVLGTVLSDGVGWASGLTIVGLVAMAVTTGLPFRGVVRGVAMAGAVVAPLGFAITGHTRTMDPAWLAYLADLVHVAAAALWFGGLGALIALQRRRRQVGDVVGAAGAVARFSGAAGGVIVALVLAGGALGLIEVGGLHALTTTTYGRLLMVKVALVGVILALAGWNRFAFVPSVVGSGTDRDDLEDGQDTEAASETAGAGGRSTGVEAARWKRFDTIVRAEVLGIVAVLAVTGVLTNVVPAKTAVRSGPVTVSAPLGQGTAEVIIDPARAGRNDVHVYLLDERGAPDGSFEDAAFELSLPSADIGPLTRDPVLAGAGHFQLVGVDLPIKGEWNLKVTVKVDRFTEETATVGFRVR